MDSRMNWLNFSSWRSRSLWPHVRPSTPVNISQQCLKRNFFTFGTHVHLELSMNWLDVDGQRSRPLWFQEYYEIFLDCGNFSKFGINVHLDSKMNTWDFGGQRSLWHHVCPVFINAVFQPKCLECMNWLEWV